MLSPAAATQVFQEDFSITIQVMEASAGGGEGEEPAPPTPSTTVPTVTRSFEDPGVTVTPSAGQVVISGKYTSILKMSWQWIDNANNLVTTVEPPKKGEYTKITKMDAPPSLTEDCTYTIGGESFVHTVTLVSYSKGRDALLDLLKDVK